MTTSADSLQSSFVSTVDPWAARFLDLPRYAQVAIWFAIILTAKSGSLFEPPVWDSAMGVFPPAIYLYESGFDIRALLQETTWNDGGPNVHSLSAFTWFIATIMSLTDSAVSTFAIVHLTTYLLVAFALERFSGTLRLSGLLPSISLVAGALVFCLPIVGVQVGYLYTETWVMALGILSWSHWQADRRARAVLTGAAALFVKLTGIAIVVCIGAALVCTAISRARDRRTLLLLPVLPVTYLALKQLPTWLGAAPVPGAQWGDAEKLGEILVERLIAVPDVTLILLAGCLASLAYAVHIIRESEQSWRAFFAGESAVEARLICMIVPFVFVVGIIWSVFSQIIFLPRYVVPAIPFALASILFWLQATDRNKQALVGLTVACLVSIANWNGSLYAEEYEEFSVVERSHAYRDYHQVQRDVIDSLKGAPEGLPIFVSKEVSYMISNPMMGYVDTPISGVQPLYDEAWETRSLDDFPGQFLLVLSNKGHGGKKGLRLLETANLDPRYSVNRKAFNREGFKAALVFIERRHDISARPPSPVRNSTRS